MGGPRDPRGRRGMGGGWEDRGRGGGWEDREGPRDRMLGPPGMGMPAGMGGLAAAAMGMGGMGGAGGLMAGPPAMGMGGGGPREAVLFVPPHLTGMIIGKGGAVIKGLRSEAAETECHIDLENDRAHGDGSSKIIISGPKPADVMVLSSTYELYLVRYRGGEAGTH